MLLVAQGVHRLPEPAVNPGRELAVSRQVFQRFILPYRLRTLDQFQHARLEHEKTAVDQSALGLRLLLEGDRLATLGHHAAEARRRPYAGDGRLATPLRVEGDFRADIDVRQAVAVRHAEGLARR